LSNVVPFNFEGEDIRVVTVENEPWFIAKDVAAMLGYADTDYAIRTHCKAVQSWAGESSGQVRTLKIIPERDIYRLVLKSKLPAAMRFEEWVVGDVLPSVRKTGSYAPAPVNLSDASALRGLLLGYTEQVLQLEHKISEDRPKVEYYQKVRDSTNLESIGNFAKKLSFGERKLFKWLREQKILMADNSPYQRHIDEGHFKVLDKTTDKNGKTISYSQTVLTGKGKTYVQKRLAKAGNPDLSE
jgi:prophage antirepressor-like protein